MIRTAEAVTKYHPDKICDQISDAIVDACLKQDRFSRVAVETIGGHGMIVLIGEVTTKADIEFGVIAHDVYKKLTGKDVGVLSNISKQAPEISQGVDKGGAGDQGIMVGYACNENEQKIPQELYVARRLLEPFNTDGKSQVTIKDGEITDIVLSVQGKSQEQLYEYVDMFMFRNYPKNKFQNIYCNNTGSFETGGFDADSGCTGRKIVVDAYGPRVPVGGGAFSGKDATKVDRSGAYMARWIALDMLKKFNAKEVLVKLAYVIGGDEPIEQSILVDGIPTHANYDCRPKSIISRFGLKRPIYQQTAEQGHFGISSYPWEKV